MSIEDSILIVGLGEVGKPLYEILSSRFSIVYGYDIDPSKTVNTIDEIEKPIGILHITYPFENLKQFIDATINYANVFRPSLIIVHSTVAPGTTRRLRSELSSMVVYSPIRGKHPLMRDHLEFWTKWIASVDGESIDIARRHLEQAGFKVRVAPNPESLELAKLWETVYRAVMITSWQEIHRLAVRFGASIETVAEFISEVHEVLKDRPVYYPDVIGGHCLIQNTEILLSCAESKLLEFILSSNEMRKEEVKDERIAKDIESVKKIWMRHALKSYYKLDE